MSLLSLMFTAGSQAKRPLAGREQWSEKSATGGPLSEATANGRRDGSRPARGRHGHSPRFLMAERVNRGLRGTPMAGLGFELEAAGWRYHVSPALMAAIAGTESGFGVAACSNNARNVWGLASCNQSWQVPYWRSWHEAAFWFAAFLKSHWPSARTSYDFYGYAACSSCWGAKTAYWMRARFGLGPFVRYP